MKVRRNWDSRAPKECFEIKEVEFEDWMLEGEGLQ